MQQSTPNKTSTQLASSTPHVLRSFSADIAQCICELLDDVLEISRDISSVSVAQTASLQELGFHLYQHTANPVGPEVKRTVTGVCCHEIGLVWRPASP